MARRGNRRSGADWLFDGANGAILAVLSLLFVYPFLYCFILSFNDGFDAVAGGIYLWPRAFTLDNYQKALTDPLMLRALFNTVLRTGVGVAVFLFFTGMFCYGVTRERLLFKKGYLALGIVTMYFSGGLIPTYLVMRALGLINHFLVYILPNVFSMFYAMIMISNLKTVPAALEESARIDGANDFVIFWRVIAPTCKPVFACLALYVGVGHWNAWFDTMLYANVDSLQTLSHMLISMVNNQRYLDSLKTSQTALGVVTAGATSASVTMATMVVTAFPIIVLYPFLQKYFIKGIMIGSVKG